MKLVINGQTVEVPSGGSSGGTDFPAGGIIIWSGAADNIPTGWVLCDGQNDTPDLRDRFVLGAGTKHAVGETDGEEEVTLTVAQMPEHSHDFQENYGYVNSGKYTGIYFQEVNTNYYLESQIAGGSQPHNNMPPYYALCYIMKL